jgi:16S rRNA (uracil1498-N3)-methyltransferase
MRSSRIYTDQVLDGIDRVGLRDNAAHYLSRVLRVCVGDGVILFNGNGRDYSGNITDVQRQQVNIDLTGDVNPVKESPLRITLVQAICRGERMDYSLQKATELGVHAVQPVFTHRVGVKLAGKRLASRMDHWRAVVISSCEQSGRAMVPGIWSPMSFEQWLSCNGDTESRTLRILLDPLARMGLTECIIPDGDVCMLVGPEGGMSPDEIDQARSAGVTAVSIGPRIMRTETAGPAAIAVLQALAGDFRSR